jgi:hypothetical protein
VSDLLPGQWAIGEGSSEFVFGEGTSLMVDPPVIGDYEVRATDSDLPEEDGAVPGLDLHGGRTITLDVSTDCTNRADAVAAWGQLAAAWDARATRFSPRAVTVLRMRFPGAPDEVAVYGRPRKLTPSRVNLLEDGVAELVLSFEAFGKEFWGPEQNRVLTLGPNLTGGLHVPLTVPVLLDPISGGDADVILNDGVYPTWPVITFTGPVSLPSIRWQSTGATLLYEGTLATGQTLTVDTRPQARTILLDGLAAPAGQMRGDALADLSLPVGPTVVAYSGADPGGASSCTIRWRTARANL